MAFFPKGKAAHHVGVNLNFVMLSAIVFLCFGLKKNAATKADVCLSNAACMHNIDACSMFQTSRSVVDDMLQMSEPMAGSEHEVGDLDSGSSIPVERRISVDRILQMSKPTASFELEVGGLDSDSAMPTQPLPDLSLVVDEVDQSPGGTTTNAVQVAQMTPQNSHNSSQFVFIYVFALVVGLGLVCLGLFTAFGTCCGIKNAGRFVPFWYCFAFGISVIGASLAYAGTHVILETFSDMNATGSRIDTSGLDVVCLISFCGLLGLDALALLHGLVGTGCLRESIFGTQHQPGRCWARWTQCMLGPTVTCTLRILLWISFAFQVFLSYMFFLLLIALASVGTCCGTTDAVSIKSLVGINQVLKETGIGSVDLKFVHDFCSTTNDVDQAALVSLLGCVFAVASQSILSSTLSAEPLLGSDHGSRGSDRGSDEARQLEPKSEGRRLCIPSVGSPRGSPGGLPGGSPRGSPRGSPGCMTQSQRCGSCFG